MIDSVSAFWRRAATVRKEDFNKADDTLDVENSNRIEIWAEGGELINKFFGNSLIET